MPEADTTPATQAILPDLAAEISRKIARVHPSHHASTIPVTIKISRTYAEMQALVAALTPSALSGDAGEARECPNSPSGKHQVDTSMEEGPHHCFHCSVNMRAAHQGAGE